MNRFKRYFSLVLIGIGATAVIDGAALVVIEHRAVVGGLLAVAGLTLCLSGSIVRRKQFTPNMLMMVASVLAWSSVGVCVGRMIALDSQTLTLALGFELSCAAALAVTVISARQLMQA